MASPYGLELVESCIACKLRGRTYFCALPRRTRRALERIKFSNLLPKGSPLFVAGQMPTGVYLVCAGKVKLCIQRAAGDCIVVRIAGPGEVMGLHACIHNTPHELTAETMQPCQIVFVRTDDFLHLLKQDGSLCLKTAQALSLSCHDAQDMVRAVAPSHTASEKLARLLLELVAGAKPRRGSLRVPVNLTHKEIAEAMGISRATLRRKLAEFRSRRIARLKSSTLLVTDKAALQRIAGT